MSESKSKKTEEKKKPIDISLLEKVEKVNKELTAENIKSIIEDNSSDLETREIYIAGDKNKKATIFFVSGLVKNIEVGEIIIKPLVNDRTLHSAKTTDEIIELIEKGAVYFPAQKKREEIDLVINDILNGETAIVFDQKKLALTFDTKGFEFRGIGEPTSENVYKGAKDSFIEALRINTARVRRKIRSKDLVIREIYIGKRTLTPVALVYINSIANEDIVNALKDKIQTINEDAVLTTSAIEEYIIENKMSAFPQVINTERPDKFCSAIVDGGVGLLVEGIPFSFIIPATLNQLMQAPEDYSNNYTISTLLRIIRYIGMITGFILPGLYLAIVMFQQVLLPPELALSIKAAKESVPFSSLIEIILMLLSFEILQEAGIRLPKTIGQTVSIIGALVVGQAAVEAKIVSPVVVIIVAFMGISSFTMPNQDFRTAIRMYRILIVLLSSFFGLVGVSIGVLFILYGLCQIESFGIPYLYPYVGTDNMDLDDSLIRLPVFMNKKRPNLFKTNDQEKR